MITLLADWPYSMLSLSLLSGLMLSLSFLSCHSPVEWPYIITLLDELPYVITLFADWLYSITHLADWPCVITFPTDWPLESYTPQAARIRINSKERLFKKTEISLIA